MFQTVLVANRGEIACRVIRALRDLGVRAVAVYSDADADAPHVRMADEAYRLGEAAAADSYLRGDRILAAAAASGAEAIHPGYGFLSENAAFVEACGAAGVTFIGPSAEAMRVMGSKTDARKAMIDAGVPVVPGTTEPCVDADDARRIAADLGYPVLLKASAGGGGKGMRLVSGPEELGAALDAARREAAGAFGDDAVYLEKAIVGPRHIEIQVLADQHGHAVHLFERECSVQRRHQKVIEEAPACGLRPEVRAQMGAVAVAGTRAIDYVGAGTFEFLVDAEQNFYFLEMNTRLQVEHPVTELICGVDLCALQIRVAAGEPLPFAQEDLAPQGHAIECRIYAEDPAQGFAPAPGRLTRYRPPRGPGVRVDDGVREGDTISTFYDPMIAKLCTWGATRDEARRRALRALREYEVGGIRQNVDFLGWVLESAPFTAGRYTTGLLGELGPWAPPAVPPDQRERLVLAACLQAASAAAAPAASEGDSAEPSAWRWALAPAGRGR